MMHYENLVEQRHQLLQAIGKLGHFRPGKVYQRLKKCSNRDCPCYTDESRRHGPYYYISRKQPGQRTKTQVIPEAALEAPRTHLENYARFRELVAEMVEVSDQLCQAEIHPRGVKKTLRHAPRKAL